MNDREFLEQAAKAAGKKLIWGDLCPSIPLDAETMLRWNPLTDDGDALRLAIRLGISFHCIERKRITISSIGVEPHDGDMYAATRRAIVRAAAEIGRGM